MPSPPPPVELRECRYVIFFRLTQRSQDAAKKGYKPTISLAEVNEEIATLPLGLDRSFIPVIPVLWYCLHLPRSRYDLLKCPPTRLKTLQVLNVPQTIKLVPIPCPPTFLSKIHDNRPTIVFVPDKTHTSESAIPSYLGFCSRQNQHF